MTGSFLTDQNRGRVKIAALAGLLVGGAIVGFVLSRFGLPHIVAALAKLGFAGFGAIVGFQLVLAGGAGLAWWLLGYGRPDARPWRFIWGRLVRDAAAQALPLSHLGGVVLGSRALALAGVGGRFAAASSIVDIAVELSTELAYAAIGLGLLAVLRPRSALLLPSVLGLVAMAILASLFALMQTRGEHLIRWLPAAWQAAAQRRAAVLRDAYNEVRRDRLTLGLAGISHLVCWILTGLQAWLTLWLMGAPLPLLACIVIDSLTFGLRSLAFMVPGALGVQEGAFVLLGGLFGLSPHAAIALSLARRGRDLAIALPALIGWHYQEGRRLWRWGAQSANGAQHPSPLPGSIPFE